MSGPSRKIRPQGWVLDRVGCMDATFRTFHEEEFEAGRRKLLRLPINSFYGEIGQSGRATR